MQFSTLISLIALAAFGSAATIEHEKRGGIPCDYSGVHGFEPCPEQWPVCIKFPSSCTTNCAGICGSA